MRRSGPSVLVILTALLGLLIGGLTPTQVLAQEPEPASTAAYVSVETNADGTLAIRRYETHNPESLLQDHAIVAIGPEIQYELPTPGPAESVAPRRDLNVAPMATYPNDPYRSSLWAHDRLEIEEVWEFGNGQRRDGGGKVVVAVIDSGVDTSHPDLGESLLPGASFVGYNGVFQPGQKVEPVSRNINDVDGHGTHIIGTIAATVNNNLGVAGIAPHAAILPVKVIHNGSGTNTALAAAILWAVNEGADIINLSLGVRTDDPVVHAVVTHAANQGVLLLAAIGNCGSTPLPAACGGSLNQVVYPAAWPETLAIGATVANPSPPWNDQLLPISTRTNLVDLVAPGGGIYSTWPGNSYNHQNGTSMATAVASGTAADVWSAFPADSALGVRSRLVRNSIDLGPNGKDPSFGHGLINPLGVFTREEPDPLSGLVGRQLTEYLEHAACNGLITDVFPDVSGNEVHGATISCLFSRGITQGSHDGKYHPAQPVTRAQMASFLERLITNSSGRVPAIRAEAPDAFNDDNHSVHQSAINNLAAAGIVAGRSDGSFGPEEPVTRGQMASFLVRTYEYRTTNNLEFDSGVAVFDDLDQSVHAEAILVAAETGFAAGRSDGSFGINEPVTRAQMASFLTRVFGRLVVEDHTA